MNHYELLVFDWDGTLMDSAAKIVACFRAAASDVGLPPPSCKAVRHLIGLELSESFLRLYPGVARDTLYDVVDCYRVHWLERDTTPMPMFDGVADGLRALEQAGYLLAVATGKSDRGLRRVLAETGLGGHFVTTRCADQSRSKPHPQMLLDILDYSGLAAGQALMIGDTTYDLEMASGAGMDGWGVSWGSHEVSELEVGSRYRVADSFPALADILLGVRDQNLGNQGLISGSPDMG